MAASDNWKFLEVSGTKEIISDAGFEWRKWKTNNRELQKYFDSDRKSDLFIVGKYTT